MSAARRRRPAPDHSADAGSDPQVLEVKQGLRQQVWDALDDAGAARFPGAHGRIPNFAGAGDAAGRLAGLDGWRRARVIKANPDSPQWPVRQRALADGIAVYMAAPKLAAERPFLRLDPGELDVTPRQASSIKGAGRHGRPVTLAELEPVDLVVVGSVAVDRRGARLGKGGGFADLEFALAREAGLIGDDALVVTTVHPLQVLDGGQIPTVAHDVSVDLVVTPEEVIECAGAPARPGGVRWDELTDDKIAAIPLLARLAERR